MDQAHTGFETLVLASKCENEDPKGFLGLIRLGVVTEKIADAASQISEVVLRGIKPHPILKLAIREAEETVFHMRVATSSVLVGKTLREARIPEETGMWILAIKRDGKCIRARSDLKIEVGDVLIASGYSDGEVSLSKLAT